MADVQLSEKLQKIATEIEALTVVEVADLAKYLEEKFGVTAMAAVAAPAAGAAAGPVEEAPAAARAEGLDGFAGGGGEGRGAGRRRQRGKGSRQGARPVTTHRAREGRAAAGHAGLGAWAARRGRQARNCSASRLQKAAPTARLPSWKS